MNQPLIAGSDEASTSVVTPSNSLDQAVANTLHHSTPNARVCPKTVRISSGEPILGVASALQPKQPLPDFIRKSLLDSYLQDCITMNEESQMEVKCSRPRSMKTKCKNPKNVATLCFTMKPSNRPVATLDAIEPCVQMAKYACSETIGRLEGLLWYDFPNNLCTTRLSGHFN